MHKSLELCARLLLVCAPVACGSEAGDLFTGSGGETFTDGGGATSGSGGFSGESGSAGEGGSGAIGVSGSGGSSDGSGGESGSNGTAGEPGDAATSDGATSDGATSDAASDAGASGAPSDAGGDGSAGNCTHPTTYYADSDKDGYGDPKTSLSACSQPALYVTNADDCYDGNKEANPAQTGWFPDDRGDGSFDYDCNGMETSRYQEIGRCESLAICMTTPGWQESAPGCGTSKAWIKGCTFPLCTPPITEQRYQECH